jgi:hypothetical protein
LRKFHTDSGSGTSKPIGDCAHESHIYKANKIEHFRRIKATFPQVEFSEMLFFDNEKHNLDSVSKLGVKCVHCPEGMSASAWEQGLSLFS